VAGVTRAPPPAATAVPKRSPPATPPAVLINTAERPSLSGEGKRTRKEPDSCRRPRLVTPSSQRTSKRTAPCARLAAKIAEAGPVSVRILPPEAATGRVNASSQSHLAADLARVEVLTFAGIFH